MTGLPDLAKVELSTSILSPIAARSAARPQVKPESDAYGPTVPLSLDSDDEFNPALVVQQFPRKWADSSSVASGASGGRKKARTSAAVKAEHGRARLSSPKMRSEAQPAAGSKRYRFGLGFSDEEPAHPAAPTSRRAARIRDDDEDDDFDRAARKKRPGKQLQMQTAAQREMANPLRFLAGKSPLSDSDDELEAVDEMRAIVGIDGILRRVKVDRPLSLPTASAKGKEREVIEIDGSDTDDGFMSGCELRTDVPALPMVVDESSGSSCTSDEDLDFAVKLEQRQAEKAWHGRVLGHRERRKLRRKKDRIGPSAITPALETVVEATMDIGGSGAETDGSDDGDKTLEEMAAKVERLRQARAQEVVRVQSALAAAGPTVPPPLPAQLAPLSSTGGRFAEPSTSDASADGSIIARPSSPQIEHRPAFDPPVAQQAFGSLELEANTDGSGLPATSVNRHINRQLREYQRDGVRFLWSRYRDGKGGILGDDMGLGKTIQVIAFLSAIMGFSGERSTDHNRKVRWSNEQIASGRMKKGIHLDNPRPNEQWPTALIIAPSSVCENWVRELETWGYFSVGYYIGVPRERSKIMREYKQGWYDIMIMSLDTARNSIEDYKDEYFSVVFVDEVHKVKNPKAQLTRALKQLEHPARFGLTGTAIQNRFEEFWCILDWARPGEVGNKEDWDVFITKPIKNGQSHDATVEQVLQGRVRASQLVTKILPHFFLRRTKALIAHQMPRKIDKVVLCSLTPRQYDCLARLRATPEVQKMTLVSQGLPVPPNLQCVCVKDQMFPFVTMFKKVANHLALILPQPQDDLFTQRVARQTFETIYPEVAVDELVAPELLESRRDLCGKWEALNQLLDLWRPYSDSTENKVLIFSSSVRLLKIIAGFLTQEGREFLFLHGGIPTGDRMPLIDKFQSDPNVYVFLISTLAGGVGLNLTAANKVVIFDPSWNPSNDLQAMDRAFRIGQKSDVEVYRLVAAGSIEENIYTRQLYKQQMSSIGYDGKFEKRMFDGIIDERGQKGELFGLHNLFELKEDANKTESILDRIRDAELPFADAVADDFDDEKSSLLSLGDKDVEDIGSLLAAKDDQESRDEEITDLLSHAGAAYISSDKDLLGQEERERRIFDECRRYRKEHRHEAKSTKAFSLKRQKSEGEPAVKKSAVKEKDANPLFAPPVRVKKTDI